MEHIFSDNQVKSVGSPLVLGSGAGVEGNAHLLWLALLIAGTEAKQVSGCFTPFGASGSFPLTPPPCNATSIVEPFRFDVGSAFRPSVLPDTHLNQMDLFSALSCLRSF